MRKESLDYGIRYTRGNFLNVVPVYRPDDERTFKFELYNNRVRARRPVAALTVKAATVIREGMVKRCYEAALEIRPDVPFSQEELSDLPDDVATLIVRELGGNPLKEEFVIRITCQINNQSNPKNNKIISETCISGGVDLKSYNIFAGNALEMSSGY